MYRYLALFQLLLSNIGSTVRGQQCDEYPALPSGSFNVTSKDGSRTWQVFTPWNEFSCSGYCVGPPKTPRPLVINWHGCNAHVPVVAYQEQVSQEVCSPMYREQQLTRTLVAQVSKIEQAASDYGWYAITPVGTKEGLISEFGWNTLGIKCGKVGVDDFKFADELLDWASKNLCVDLDRVYSTGFSTGAFHSYSLACRKPSKFAGIAPIAGSIGRVYYNECESGDPVSVLSFHSKDDKTVPYSGEIARGAKRRGDNVSVRNESRTVSFFCTRRTSSISIVVIIVSKLNPFRDSLHSSQETLSGSPRSP